MTWDALRDTVDTICAAIGGMGIAISIGLVALVIATFSLWSQD